MPEVQQVSAGVQARRACLRVRLWPLPGSAQLLRQVAAEVLGVAAADSLPLVVVSPADGLRSVAVARRSADIPVDVPLADLVVGVPVGVSGDGSGDLVLTVCLSAAVAQRLQRLRAGWGVAGGGRAWMRLMAEPVASAAARCGPLAPLVGGDFLPGRPARLRRSRGRRRRRSGLIGGVVVGSSITGFGSVCLRLFQAPAVGRRRKGAS